MIFTGEFLLTPYQVGDNETNFNTIIDYTLFYDRTYATTETYPTSETYALVAYPQQVAAGVPEPAGLVLLAFGLARLASDNVPSNWAPSSPFNCLGGRVAPAARACEACRIAKFPMARHQRFTAGPY